MGMETHQTMVKRPSVSFHEKKIKHKQDLAYYIGKVVLGKEQSGDAPSSFGLRAWPLSSRNNRLKFKTSRESPII
jgi:hypothetical protein